MKIHESAENYLETILILQHRNGMVRSVDIANELGFSKPSVSIFMKNLRENGYIVMASDGYIDVYKRQVWYTATVSMPIDSPSFLTGWAGFGNMYYYT